MMITVALLVTAVAFLAFGGWGWQHAEELVPASTPAYRRSAKRRQLRRGAASFLSVAVVLTALAIAKLCGWHY
ncbi:MAG TPA: hypothetical protein VGM75_19760 [Pseudonocardiaceae bacterium]|jgi:hypothetical protein